MPSPPPSATDRSPRALRAVLLTVLIDVAGFSIVFPLFPALLRYYLEREGPASLVGRLVDLLGRLAHAPGDSFFVTVLFGGVLGSVYSLLQFFSAPILGRISDRVGRRPVLIATMAGHVAGYALWALSGSFALLVGSRLLNGAMSGNLSVASAAIADATGRTERARGMALFGVVLGVGLIVGPVLGGTLSLVDLSARYPSWAALGVNPFSAPALAAALLSLANLVRLVTHFPETLSGSAAPARGRGRLRQVLTTGTWSLRCAVLIHFSSALALGGLEFTLTFLAAERMGFGPAENVRLFLFVGLVLVLAQGLLVRRLAPRWGEPLLTRLGLLLGAISFVGLALADTWLLFFASLVPYALGAGLFIPSLSALVSLYSSDEEQGENLGVFRSAAALARGVGPIGGSLFYFGSGSRLAYLLGGALMLVPLALAFGLPRPTPSPNP